MSVITVLPAIDLKGGRCVRLRQGRADEETVYADDPVEVARRWVSEGAAYLHVVDLDGAFEGRPVHHEVIARIADSIDIPIEAGGGLRTEADVRGLLEGGVDRVIMGTRALGDPVELQSLIDTFGEQFAVGIDARDGRVQVKGWTETTGERAVDLACRVDKMGVSTIIYTDTATDGMMAGTNIEAIDEVCGEVTCSVIASGGISSVDDMARLRRLARPNLVGAIVGKALYEERVTLAALQS